MTSFKNYTKLFWELIITDFTLTKQKVSQTLINTIIWVTSITLVTSYVLPQLGIDRGYGNMILISSIMSCGVFEIFGNTSIMVSDLDGDRTISYLLTLPLPGWALLVEKAVSFAIHSALLTIMILPLGKFILGNQLLLSNVKPFHFLAAFITLHLFCGFFALVAIAYTKSMQNILHVWTRLLFPLWYFGGAQFNWHTLKGISPWLAHLSLLNPLVYPNEAMKEATLGAGNYLPFWPCIGMTVLFSVLFLVIAHKKMQKRLDYL